METHKECLEEVKARLAPIIRKFLLNCMAKDNGLFHAAHLRRFVSEELRNVAPSSADRILRDMRQRRAIDYKLLSRRNSYYQVVRVGDIKLR